MGWEESTAEPKTGRFGTLVHQIYGIQPGETGVYRGRGAYTVHHMETVEPDRTKVLAVKQGMYVSCRYMICIAGQCWTNP
jgi:hypothetical protein